FDEKDLPLKAKAMLDPERGFDIGRGKGTKWELELSGGVVGIVLDGRGRPFKLPTEASERVRKLKEWMTELDVYPKEALDKF
ncbi:MAG: hypothetical protein ACE5JC_08805, partial [Candidatus Zixiibacteriota bacterium]